VGYALLKAGVENDAAYARLVMQATEREWHKTIDKPLKLIAGPFVLVSAASFYGTDHPSTYADLSPYLSPWVDDARIARDGMAIMCDEGPFCTILHDKIAQRFGEPRTKVIVERRWLGFTSAPARFAITIVPPR
jgi:hypothetical protein